jgi:hypothetical protein
VGYLKEASRCVACYLSGTKVMLCEGSIRVGLSGGLPTILPASLRTKIRINDNLSIRLALTILAFYRVIYVPAVPKISTITSGWKVGDYAIFGSFRKFVQTSFIPNLSSFKGVDLSRKLERPRLWINLSTGASIAGISSIVAIYEAVVLQGYLEYDSDELLNDMQDFATEAYGSEFCTYFLKLLRRYKSFYMLLSWIFLIREEDSEVISTPKGKRTVPSYSYQMRENASGKVSWFRRILGSIWLSIPLGVRPYVILPKEESYISRLSPKIEPAGKMRLFAIVDYWTQYLLRPLHDWLFSILEHIPQDGTFDQDRAVKTFQDLISRKEDRHVYSFDLSAATDRLHFNLIVILLNGLFGGSFGLY